MKRMKKFYSGILAMLLVLALLPSAVRAAEPDMTQVENWVDFTKLQENNDKDAVKAQLEADGLFEVNNLFLDGNHEPIVHPGGYNGQGWIIQKIEAAPGETIQNAMLNLGYWICNGEPQGYIEVLVSADNTEYTKVWECREGNGPAFENTRRTANIVLPFEEGQTTIYVKIIMEHWSTCEGAAVAYSHLTVNNVNGPVESDKAPEECTMVTVSHNFNGLPNGELEAEDIGAVEEKFMYYDQQEMQLLCARNGYESAHAVWLLEAAEGEPLHDAVLTIVGRTWFKDPAQKDNNSLRVYASVDNITYTEVHKFTSNDNPDDTQRFTVDLTEVAKGYGQVYVKLEWLVFDTPNIMGIRSVTITGNTAGMDNSGGGSSKMPVTNIQSFTSLPVGEADKTALDAFKTANLMFGYNKTPLLTQAAVGEDAYATWKLTAREGEPFEDCRLVLVGRFGYEDAAKKDTASLRLYFSVDGESYTEIKQILPTEDQSDTQVVTLDLSARAYGLSELYIRVYWKSEDDPAAMGLRSMSLIANAGDDYEQFLPELENRDLSQENQDPGATEPVPTEPAPGQTDQDGPDALVWVIAAVAVAVAAVTAAILLKKKKA